MLKPESEAKVRAVIDGIAALSEEERMRFLELYEEAYCKYCGAETGGKTCWGCYDSPYNPDE